MFKGMFFFFFFFLFIRILYITIALDIFSANFWSLIFSAKISTHLAMNPHCHSMTTGLEPRTDRKLISKNQLE